MGDEMPTTTSLTNQDVWAIVGRARVGKAAVEDYLLARRRTQDEKRYAIENALRDLGWEHLIRPADNEHARLRSTPPEGQLVGAGRR